MTDAQTPPEPPVEPSPFIAWLRDQLDGETLEELDTGLKEIIAVADLSGRKTKLTLVLDADKKGRTVALKADVTVKIPPPVREADIWFPDRDGGLHREDPMSPKLTFGASVLSIVGDHGEPRRIDTSTGEIAKSINDQTGEAT